MRETALKPKPLNFVTNSLAQEQNFNYLFGEAVRAALGCGNPYTRLMPAVTASHSLTLGRGACGVCPGSSELKATGPSCTVSNSPIIGLSEFSGGAPHETLHFGVPNMKRHNTAAVHSRSSRRAQAAQSCIARESVHPVDVHVGRQIRIRRMQSDVSLGDLGAGIGVSLQQVQKYESGKNRVSASMLYELANCLKIPVSKFFEGLPDPEASQGPLHATEIDERIAYISTAEGRRLIEDVLLLPSRVRSRVVALVSSIVDEEMKEQSDVDR